MFQTNDKSTTLANGLNRCASSFGPDLVLAWKQGLQRWFNKLNGFLTW